MTDLSGKIGYIQGLMEGLKLDKNDDTVKLLSAITEALASLNEEVRMLKEQYTELNEYVEHIDDDLAELEMVQADTDEDNVIDDDWSKPYFDKGDKDDDGDDDDE